MRKIYSLVLMTAMLFVGANAWGTTYNKSVENYAQLIAAVEGGTDNYDANTVVNITLTANIDTTFTYKRDSTTNANLSTAKSLISEIYKGQTINLNLNGYSIDSKALYVFSIYYGKLIISGQGTISNLLERYKTDNVPNDSNQYRTKFAEASTILMVGIDDNTVDSMRTYLNVGPDVNIICNKGKAGVYVNQNDTEKHDQYGGKTKTQKNNEMNWNSWSNISYTYVDSKGKTQTAWYKCAYGVLADIYGKVHGMRYGLQMSGNINKVDATSACIPTYHVWPSADVSADNKVECSGMYLGGYCRAIIEGTVYGSTGVYIKSGITVINNATVYSTGTTYVQPGAGSGIEASGSGVVMDTNKGYAGEIDVTVSGDSKITGNAGYAIDEKVTYVQPNQTDTTSNVNALTIEGGTIEGGTEGAIAISETTKKDNEDAGKTTTITVGGGNIEGESQVGNTGNLNDLLDTDSVSTTTVNVGGKTVIVITKDTVPAASRAEAVSIAAAYDSLEAHKPHIYVELSTLNSIDTIKGTDLTIDRLTMTTNNPKVVVKNGSKLIVGTVQMNADACIEVQAGATFIITGEQGIYAPNENNIVLYSTETSQATFLFNPAVTSNRQPGATVQLYTHAKQIGTNNYNWQRFTTPLHEMNSIASDWSVKHQTLSPASPYSTLRTSIYGWNTTQLKWESVLASNMKAFTGYQITNNSQDGGVTYSFKGNLQGNVTSDINFQAEGFNFFGNSYTAPANIKSLLNQMPSTVDKVVYLWNTENQRYDAVSAYKILNDPASVAYVEIPSMQTFIFRLNEGINATADINYANSVWEWNTNPSNPIFAAPARANNNINKVRINIASEGQIVDYVNIYEDGNYSDEFESGADVMKYMEEGKVNMYVNDNLSEIVTDNVLGTMISIQTLEDINYTLSFDNVGGEVYALRDNQNNTVVLMNEGAIYNFTAQPNATLDGRFQIVSRQEMPTAVETIEETVAPKAIYTVMGQYVGETTDWNNLPAGVYVVDGVKVIK